jgi:hypothetical protein
MKEVQSEGKRSGRSAVGRKTISGNCAISLCPDQMQNYFRPYVPYIGFLPREDAELWWCNAETFHISNRAVMFAVDSYSGSVRFESQSRF